MAYNEPKVSKRGGKSEEMMGKEILKKDEGVNGFPLQHAHRMQSRLFKDNQLRCKCSLEKGVEG